MAPPACETAEKRVHMVQTTVVKLSGAADGLGCIRHVLIVDGHPPGAYAVVKLNEFNSDLGISIVLAPMNAHSFKDSPSSFRLS